MKCPKCGYVSYDYLDACRKCSVDLVDFKTAIHLEVIRPGDLDLECYTGRSGRKDGHASAYILIILTTIFSVPKLCWRSTRIPDEEVEEFDISR